MAEQTFTAEELENSFPLDQARRFAQPGGRDLVERIQTVIDGAGIRTRKRKAEDEKRFKVTVEALLANVVAAHRNIVDPTRFVAVSLSRDDYRGSDLSFKAMQDCCQRLREAGLVEFRAGFRRSDQFGDSHFGRRSRIRAAPVLRELIDNTDLGKRPLAIPASRLVRIKNPRNGVGGAPSGIEASRSLLQAVNKRLANTEIAVGERVMGVLRTGLVENEGEDAEALGRKRRYAGDLTATSIYRAFKGDWKSGGRIYGGWWMSFPRALRPYLTIDGEPVVELDYKTLHPVLLYSRVRAQLNFDPYVVPPWRGAAMRELGKRTFNRLLNRTRTDPAQRLNLRAARGDAGAFPSGLTFPLYRDCFLAQLAAVEHFFGTGEGVHLQYEDSELAIAVMANLEAADIPVLPIHDSFMVAARHERRLHQAMENAFFIRYGQLPAIDRKTAPAATPPHTLVHNWAS